MSFTTINTFNSNLWKGGGKVKPSLYGLSVRTADLNVNSITLTYRYAGVSYVMIDMIGSSGYISSQPRFNVVSSPVTKLITGLNPNTYYNFVLVPYDINNIRGSSYYFSGFTSGASTFTSINTAITSTSTPINYSNLTKPLCTLSAINSLTNTLITTANFNINSLKIDISCTDLSYVNILLNGTNTIISKPTGSGVINSLISNINLPNLPFAIATLTTAYTYSYTITVYNNAGIANPVPITGSYTRPALIANTNGTITTYKSYYFITFNNSSSITFNKNISSKYTADVLLVGCGGIGGAAGGANQNYNYNPPRYVGGGGGGGGGSGQYNNFNYIFNSDINFDIVIGSVGSFIDSTINNNNNLLFFSKAGYNGLTGGKGKAYANLGGDGGNGGNNGNNIFLGGNGVVTSSTSETYTFGGNGGGGAGAINNALDTISGSGIMYINDISYSYGGQGGQGGQGYVIGSVGGDASPGVCIITFIA